MKSLGLVWRWGGLKIVFLGVRISKSLLMEFGSIDVCKWLSSRINLVVLLKSWRVVIGGCWRMRVVE